MLALYESDEQIVRVCNSIPNSDKMERIIIEKQQEVIAPEVVKKKQTMEAEKKESIIRVT